MGPKCSLPTPSDNDTLECLQVQDDDISVADNDLKWS